MQQTHSHKCDRHWVSWSVIFVGMLVAFIVSIILSFLIAAVSNKGLNFNILASLLSPNISFSWSNSLVILISLAVGGWIAGHFAGYSGMMHGFLTWGLTMFFLLLIGVLTQFAPQKNNPLINIGRGGIQIDIPSIKDNEIAESLRDFNGELKKLFRNVDLSNVQNVDFNSLLGQVQQNITQSLRDANVYPAQSQAIISNLVNRLSGWSKQLDNHLDANKVLPFLKATGMTDNEAVSVLKKADSLYGQLTSLIKERLGGVQDDLLKSKSMMNNQANRLQNNIPLVNSGNNFSNPYYSPFQQNRLKYSFWRSFITFIMSGIITSYAGLLGARSHCHNLNAPLQKFHSFYDGFQSKLRKGNRKKHKGPKAKK